MLFVITLALIFKYLAIPNSIFHHAYKEGTITKKNHLPLNILVDLLKSFYDKAT